MKFDFDTYEFAGLIAPGSVVILAILLLHPEMARVADAAVVIAMAVIGAYVFGHLVAAVGNLSERLFDWLGAGRMHSLPLCEWRNRYLAPCQQRLFMDSIDKLPIGDIEDDAILDLEGGGQQRRSRHTREAALVKQMYLAVSNKEHRQRLDTFKALHNLSRGLCVSFVVAGALSVVSAKYGAAVFCLIAAALSVYCMRKFADRYSRELVQQFLFLRQA